MQSSTVTTTILLQLVLSIPERFTNPGISGLKFVNPGVPVLIPGLTLLFKIVFRLIGLYILAYVHIQCIDLLYGIMVSDEWFV